MKILGVREKKRYRLLSFSSGQIAFLGWNFCANLESFHQDIELPKLGLKPLLCLIQHHLE